MSRILLIHFSDIHVKGPQDPVLTRAEALAAVLQNLDLQLDAVVIAVTGDLAFAGTEEQLLLSWNLIEQVQKLLRLAVVPRERGSDVPVYVVGIPGNHDCDFSAPNILRETVVEQVVAFPNRILNKEIVDTCSLVQTAFFETLGTYGSETSRSQISDVPERLAYQYVLPIGQYQLHFVCVNTALLSMRHEQQGRLVAVPEVVPSHFPDGSVVIAMFHHPYNWVEANTAKQFQRAIERVADIVLTGHEHSSEIRSQQLLTSERNHYLEGGVLQDSEDSAASDFNVLLLDLSARKQKPARIVWDGEFYVPVRQDRSGGDAFGLNWEDFQGQRIRLMGGFAFSDEFEKFLEDPGVELERRDGALVRLSEIFVAPDLREFSIEPDKAGRVVRGSNISTLLQDFPYLVLTGDGQSGKTALSKILCRHFLEAGYVPVLVDGAVRLPLGEGLVSHLTSVAKSQYGAASETAFLQLHRSRKVVIVDDMQLQRRTGQRRNELLAELVRFADRVVVLTSETPLDAIDALTEIEETEARFQTYQLMPLGHFKREELIDKWLLLNSDREDGVTQLAHRREQLTRLINVLIGNQWLPSYPVYLLSAIQATERNIAFDPQISSYGAYYANFIELALRRNRRPEHSSVILSYLSHLAETMSSTGQKSTTDAEFRELHSRFEITYGLSIPFSALYEELVDSRILKRSGDASYFTYPYLYYYFVASWLRDHLQQENTIEIVKEICRKSYDQENANILLFLSHLSRHSVIVDEMMAIAREFFPGSEPAKLLEDVKFLHTPSESPATPSYVETDVEESRKRYLANLDARDEGESDRNAISDPELLEIDPRDSLNFAAKVLQILGQILKNFPASLEAGQKRSITEECYSLGMRMLSLGLAVLSDNEYGLGKLLRLVIQKRAPEADDNEIEFQVQTLTRFFGEVLAFGMIRDVAEAVGSSYLTQIYDQINESTQMPSYRLINAAIRLDQSAQFPETTVTRIAREMDDAPIAKAVLAHLVVRHFYLFPVSGPTKQRVCHAIGIAYSSRMGADLALRQLTEAGRG